MTPTDTPVLPVVRRATVGDEEGIARVHVDAWREAYAGIVPAAYLDSLSYGNRQAMWTQVLGSGAANQFVAIAEASGVGIVGFASGVVAPVDGTPCVGNLMTLYVLRAWQGHGLGRALFEAVVGALAELGADGLTLGVLASNPSRGFYERMGGHAVRGHTIAIGGADLEEVEYTWDRLPVSPSEGSRD